MGIMRMTTGSIVYTDHQRTVILRERKSISRGSGRSAREASAGEASLVLGYCGSRYSNRRFLQLQYLRTGSKELSSGVLGIASVLLDDD